MVVNGVPIFYIEKSLFMSAIDHCFDNKSQTDPSPWTGQVHVLHTTIEDWYKISG